MKKLLPFLVFGATPAFAAPGPFFTLFNSDFVVTVAFLLFVGVLVYLKVPGMLAKMLDDRAEGIRNDLNEAKALREEAQTLLASYERKQTEVAAQADRIVAHAKAEAEDAAAAAEEALKSSIERRLAAAEDQIASAQASAVKDVRDRAIQVAIAAASDVIAAKMTAADGNNLIDAAIGEVEAKLH
jgi:F-type H+-transporting ATPase subunit b